MSPRCKVHSMNLRRSGKCSELQFGQEVHTTDPRLISKSSELRSLGAHNGSQDCIEFLKCLQYTYRPNYAFEESFSGVSRDGTYQFRLAVQMVVGQVSRKVIRQTGLLGIFVGKLRDLIEKSEQSHVYESFESTLLVFKACGSSGRTLD